MNYQRRKMLGFRKLTITTLAAVYILIFVGGVVRSTGAGMGCPDWPKCFGNWVPPSSVSELPENYKDIYAAHREKKNQKFARYLRVIGMDETADKLEGDKQILQEADFNATKTWIEYFNRIVGVIIGFLILTVAVYSLRFRKIHPSITMISIASFILVCFQGWIGSIVVSTNLTPWTITVHMFLALLIVALLVWLVWKSGDRGNLKTSTQTSIWWTIACIGVLLAQILMGTQVREAVDAIQRSIPRSEWLSTIGKTFSIHRSFSWIVVILHIGLIGHLRKTQGIKPFPLTVILLILGTILTGAAMAYFAIPAWLQPVHLLLATGCFGMLFMLLLKLKGNVNKVIVS